MQEIENDHWFPCSSKDKWRSRTHGPQPSLPHSEILTHPFPVHRLLSACSGNAETRQREDMLGDTVLDSGCVKPKPWRASFSPALSCHFVEEYRRLHALYEADTLTNAASEHPHPAASHQRHPSPSHIKISRWEFRTDPAPANGSDRSSRHAISTHYSAIAI